MADTSFNVADWSSTPTISTDQIKGKVGIESYSKQYMISNNALGKGEQYYKTKATTLLEYTSQTLRATCMGGKLYRQWIQFSNGKIGVRNFSILFLIRVTFLRMHIALVQLDQMDYVIFISNSKSNTSLGKHVAAVLMTYQMVKASKPADKVFGKYVNYLL